MSPGSTYKDGLVGLGSALPPPRVRMHWLVHVPVFALWTQPFIPLLGADDDRDCRCLVAHRTSHQAIVVLVSTLGKGIDYSTMFATPHSGSLR